MFRQRKRIFFDRKGWDVQVVEDEFEIDRFDRDDTVYICSLSQDNRLNGSVRLLNTALENMACTVFSEMFPDLDIRSPTIWEATRFAVPPSQDLLENGISRAASEVLLGMTLFGLEAGVSQMTAIYEAANRRVYRRCGIHHVVIGTHRTHLHGTIEFGLFDITRDLERSIRGATRLGEASIQLAA